jgi:DNA-binding LacI/PurR family transcriptional regulator
VSKVLSNTPYFTEETRLKVMQAVEELGYVPNLAARALSLGKTYIIAVVFPYVYDTIFTDPLVSTILQGIETECSTRGYNILLSTPRLSSSGADDNFRRLILSGYLDGVIALDSYPVMSVLKPVYEKGIPAVAIGYHTCEYCVRSDDSSGGYLIMQHVLDLGHRQIGIISVPEETHLCVPKRLDGLRGAAASAGVDFDHLPKLKGDWSTPGGADCAKRLLERHPDLTALVCMNDRMAMGAIQQAREMGFEVPRDITVVGYDDIPMAATFSPAVTTISQQGPELGRKAARMLFEVLSGNRPEPVELPTHLIVRQSSAEPGRRE